MAPSFLLLQAITNEKTLKLKQIDRLPALPRLPPQKHVPTTLVGIPVDIYTLDVTASAITARLIAEAVIAGLGSVCFQFQLVSRRAFITAR